MTKLLELYRLLRDKDLEDLMMLCLAMMVAFMVTSGLFALLRLWFLSNLFLGLFAFCTFVFGWGFVVVVFKEIFSGSR